MWSVPPDRSSTRCALRFPVLLIITILAEALVFSARAQDRPKGDPAMAFALRSADFANGSSIPRTFTCDGEDRSPALEWTGAPEGT